MHHSDIANPLKLVVKRAEAQEYKRRLTQGLGRPIVSYEQGGMRYVLVGDKFLASANWKTFGDFLNDYIKLVLGKVWGEVEIGKADSEAHPLIIWYRKVCENQQKHYKNQSEQVKSMPGTGAVRAFYGLAYDLYLCAHNAELQELLVKRLRAAGNFESAAYEASVIATFIKAGYSIQFEDETDESKNIANSLLLTTLPGENSALRPKQFNQPALVLACRQSHPVSRRG